MLQDVSFRSIPPDLFFNIKNVTLENPYYIYTDCDCIDTSEGISTQF